MTDTSVRYRAIAVGWKPALRPLAVATVLAVVGCASFALWNVGFAGQTPDVKTEQTEEVSKLVWDSLPSNVELRVMRTRVPGGWFIVVRDEQRAGRRETPVGGAFFYPDPGYEWDGTGRPR